MLPSGRIAMSKGSGGADQLRISAAGTDTSDIADNMSRNYQGAWLT